MDSLICEGDGGFDRNCTSCGQKIRLYPSEESFDGYYACNARVNWQENIVPVVVADWNLTKHGCDQGSCEFWEEGQ
jgi:hypothetical protein